VEKTDKQTGVNRFTRILLRTVGSIASFFLLALIAVYLWVVSSSGQNWLTGKLEQTASQQLQQPLSIETVNTNLLSHFKLGGLTLLAPEPTQSDTLIQVESLNVEFRLFDLVKQPRTFERVVISGLKVNLELDSTGILNLPLLKNLNDSTGDLDAAKGEKRVAGFGVREFVLEEGSLRLEDRSYNLNLSADGCAASLTKKADHYTLAASVESVQLSSPEMTLPITNLQIAVTEENRIVSVNHLSMELPGMELTISGGGDLSTDPPTLDLQTHLEGDLALLTKRVSDYLPTELQPIEGRLVVQLSSSGSLDSLTTHLELNASDLLFNSSARIETVYFEGNLIGDHLYLDQLRAGLLNGFIEARGEVTLSGEFEHSAQFTLDSISLDNLWETLYDGDSPYSGVIKGNITTSGPLLSPHQLTAEAELQARKFLFHTLSMPDFSIRGRFENRSAIVELMQGGSGIFANGSIHNGDIQASFRGEIPEIEAWAGLAGLLELKGELKFSGLINGRRDDPLISLDAQGRQFSYKNFPVDTAVVHARWARSSGLEVESASASGSLTKIDTLAPPFDLEGLHGSFSYSLELQGTPDHPRGFVEADLRDLGRGEYQFDKAGLRIDLDGSNIRLAHLHAIRGPLGAIIEGQWSLDQGEGRSSLTFYTLPEKLDNRLLANGGRVRDLFRYKRRLGTLLMDGRQIDDVITVDITGEDFDLSALALTVPQLSDMRGKGGIRSRILISKSNVESRHLLKLYSPSYDKFSAKSVTIALSNLNGQISLDSLAVIVDDGLLSANGNLVVPFKDGWFQADSESELQFSGNTEATDLDLRIFTPLLPLEWRALGKTSWSVHIEGTPDHPSVAGWIYLDDGRLLTGPDAPPLEDIRIRVDLKKNLLILRTLTARARGLDLFLAGTVVHRSQTSFGVTANLKLNGDLVLRGEGQVTDNSVELDLSAERFNLAGISPLLPDLENLNGVINSNLHIAGPLSQPNINGSLDATGLSFVHDALHLTLAEGSIYARFAGKKLTLDSLNLALNGGTLAGNGSVHYRPNEIDSLQFNAWGSNFGWTRKGTAEAKVDTADIRFTQLGADRFKLAGVVQFGESRLTYPFPVRKLLDLLRQAQRPKSEIPTLLQKTELALRIQNSNQLWIDNNIARLRGRANMDITGTAARPILIGRLETQEGYLIYLDRRFEITQGVIDFNQIHQINPDVSLVAVNKLKSYQTQNRVEYTITLTVDGPLDNVQIGLVSDPSMSRSDILALLTLGTTRERLTGNLTQRENNSLVTALQERAEGISSQRISGFVSSRVGSLLDLEEMSIEGNLFNFGNNWGPQLVASKKLSENVEVIYETRVGHLNEQGIRLDYKLNEQFSIEGSADQRGSTGLDLKYKVKL